MNLSKRDLTMLAVGAAIGYAVVPKLVAYFSPMRSTTPPPA